MMQVPEKPQIAGTVVLVLVAVALWSTRKHTPPDWYQSGGILKGTLLTLGELRTILDGMPDHLLARRVMNDNGQPLRLTNLTFSQARRIGIKPDTYVFEADEESEHDLDAFNNTLNSLRRFS